jgi:type IV pilus assembly protein PilB
MNITEQKLKELLVEPGHITDEDFRFSVGNAKNLNKNLQDYLVSDGLIKDDQLGRLIADDFNIKFVDFDKTKIDEDVMVLVPEIVARSKKLLLFEQTKDTVKIAMNDPSDLEIIHNIQKKLGQDLEIFYVTEKSLSEALNKYKAGLKVEINQILEKLKDPSVKKEEKDNVIVSIVDRLLHYAFDNEASDIHIEPHEKKVLVRFRIDGIMHDVISVPKDLSELIATRIKILSKIRTDEHRSAQDGKFRFLVEYAGIETKVDARVSVLPVTSGENIVIRILSSSSQQFTLNDLGLMGEDLKKVKKAAKKPHGMILVTGPTGSGKTTTLYAALKMLNTRTVHVSTIEDPVEYDIDGVSQIQVNNKTNLTFAEGLRAIVRQDPDIIMVGEIRDGETAGIAVNSAMTGHLVLSTLHTNDAATALPRLADMDVEPFLISSTVNVVIAQRLVRKICEHCRASYNLTDEELKIVESNESIKALLQKNGKDLKSVILFKGQGCNVCHDTGYVGRIGVFEVLEIDSDIRKMIQERKSSDDIMKVARGKGMSTMMEDGVKKVLNGVTTIEEVLRVTKE